MFCRVLRCDTYDSLRPFVPLFVACRILWVSLSPSSPPTLPKGEWPRKMYTAPQCSASVQKIYSARSYIFFLSYSLAPKTSVSNLARAHSFLSMGDIVHGDIVRPPECLFSLTDRVENFKQNPKNSKAWPGVLRVVLLRCLSAPTDKFCKPLERTRYESPSRNVAMAKKTHINC